MINEFLTIILHAALKNSTKQSNEVLYIAIDRTQWGLINLIVVNQSKPGHFGEGREQRTEQICRGLGW